LRFINGPAQEGVRRVAGDELVDDVPSDSVKEKKLLTNCTITNQRIDEGEIKDGQLATNPLMDLFWIVALNNVAGCLRFY
jgi:hypothetical protein